MSKLAELLHRSKIVVCVGAGGVGKTTISAALALAAALEGKRVMVLTIDPARQLARSLGLSSLGLEPSEVPLGEIVGSSLGKQDSRRSWTAGEGQLFAGMLDQKGAWDAFISRHAKSPTIARRLLDNPFYRRMSSSFAGSTEFMAIEELCHLHESGDYELLVIDTPPATHAVDLLRAPERIARLFHPEVQGWLSGSFSAAMTGPLGAGRLLRERLFRFFPGLAGNVTFEQIEAFFGTFRSLFGDLSARTDRALDLLRNEETSFVLVSGTDMRAVSQTAELSGAMEQAGVRLGATVMNRLVEPMGPREEEERVLGRLLLDDVPKPVIDWLRATWSQRREREEAQRLRLAELAEETWGRELVGVPELPHDAHRLADLFILAERMGALDSCRAEG